MTDTSAVLIVEADGDGGAREALANGDFRLSGALTWDEGRRRLESDQFDLLLLDLDLTGDTRLEAVTEARRGSIVLDTDEPMLTLVTCYPFDAVDAGGPLRYVVTAALTETRGLSAARQH